MNAVLKVVIVVVAAAALAGLGMVAGDMLSRPAQASAGAQESCAGGCGGGPACRMVASGMKTTAGKPPVTAASKAGVAKPCAKPEVTAAPSASASAKPGLKAEATAKPKPCKGDCVTCPAPCPKSTADAATAKPAK
jgi:hypothetical protein